MYRVIICSLLWILLLAGCTVTEPKSFYYDEKQIVALTNAYYIGEGEQECENNTLKCDIAFDGMDTVWEYTAEKEDSLTLSYQFEVSKGKAKLVLITGDDTIQNIIEKQQSSTLQEMTTSVLSVKEGLNRIKLIAEPDTEVKFLLQTEQGTWNTIGVQ